MKVLMITALVFAVQLAQAQAQPVTQFQCVNNMFREARLNIEDHEVLVEDSYVAGSDQLELAIAERLNLKGKLHIQKTALSLPKQEANCSNPFGFLVSCKQGQATQRAYILVEGFVSDSNDISGRIALTLPVHVKRFDLNTNLESEGPIDLGSGTTVVPLNRMATEASADVFVLGKDITLSWNVFFYTKEDGQGSSCRRF